MSYDVAIIGGGMVGLSLARGLAQHGFGVAVIQDKQPELQWSDQDYATRVSAINVASYDFLQEISVWSSPLKRMKVWSGEAEIDFDAMQIGEFELGFIVENRQIVRALYQQLEKECRVDLFCPAKPQSVKLNEGSVTLSLEDGVIETKLLVGADGAQSWLREAMEIGLEQRPYYQDAIVAVVQTERAHAQTALQNFMSTGPLGVLPLTDAHQVSIVWSCDEEEAGRLMRLTDKQFNFALTNAVQDKLGFMRILSERKRIPLVMRQARRYCAERCVLLGDAAHTIHPLAGQGVNCGFSDAMCLIENLVTSREANQFAEFKYLRRYERERMAHNAMMIGLMQVFKEFSMDSNPIVTTIRSQGFKWVNQIDFLKKWFMRVAVSI